MPYTLFGYLGYFAIMIICCVIAIILAKKLCAWIIYAIGAIITLLSLKGNMSASENMYGAVDWNVMGPYWLIYFVLLIVSGIIILMRYTKSKSKSNEK